MAAELEAALLAYGLAVTSIPGKGRGLVTTRDFVPGDLIIHQEPFVALANKTLACDGCFVSDNLRKCSACKVVWYCGSTCQKSEWKLHQVECQALAALNDERKRMLTPTIRLMVRLLLRIKLQVKQAIPTTALDNYGLVDTLVSHISEIDEKQLVLYAQMANLVKLVLPLVEVDLKQIAENFSKLACNAHTICDSELRPIGTGLYPIISTINHSCVPNSVLVFEGRVAYVRAMEHVAKGTEVLISYIETAATTKTRQNELKQYFFICNCSRCIKSPNEELKENAIMEGYRCKNYKCYGFLIQDSEKKVFTCHECGTARPQHEIEEIATVVAKITKKASSLWSSCKDFLEAAAMYKTLEQTQLELCHPHSIELLRTRDTIMKILMELNDWKGALTYCKLTIPVYKMVYQRHHPMLGLQYYTCGKLEWLLEYTEDALKSFTCAMNILQITHGRTTQFMKELISRFEEARAEASYKKPDSYYSTVDD